MSNRLMKKQNTKRVNAILERLESNGYTIVDKHFHDGYFIFEISPHGVCHFHLKELPDYIFGIWLNSSKSPIIREEDFYIFGQYEPTMDKFKPSRNEVSEKPTLKSFLEGLDLICNNYERFISDTYYWRSSIDCEIKTLVWEKGWQNKDWSMDVHKQWLKENAEYKRDYKVKAQLAFSDCYKLFSNDLFEKFPNIIAISVQDRQNTTPNYHMNILLDDSNNDFDFQLMSDYLFDRPRAVHDGWFYNFSYDEFFDAFEFNLNLNDLKTKNYSLKKSIKRYKRDTLGDYLFVNPKFNY